MPKFREAKNGEIIPIKDYISFHNKFRECERNGNIKEIKCYCCEQTLLLCRKYSKLCRSSVCRDERYVSTTIKKIKNSLKDIKVDPAKMEHMEKGAQLRK